MELVEACHHTFKGGSVQYAFTSVPTYPRFVFVLFFSVSLQNCHIGTSKSACFGSRTTMLKPATIPSGTAPCRLPEVCFSFDFLLFPFAILPVFGYAIGQLRARLSHGKKTNVL
jgi:hypothetical protein